MNAEALQSNADAAAAAGAFTGYVIGELIGLGLIVLCVVLVVKAFKALKQKITS